MRIDQWWNTVGDGPVVYRLEFHCGRCQMGLEIPYVEARVAPFGRDPGKVIYHAEGDSAPYVSLVNAKKACSKCGARKIMGVRVPPPPL